MFEVRGLSVAYGLHRVLDDVSLAVSAREIVVILGANGAGKTTLLKAVSGIASTSGRGAVVVDGEEITRFAPHRIVEAGIALVPEGRGIFGELSVRENLELGAFLGRARSREAANRETVLSLFPRLAERRGQTARTLSGGEQQMLAIGRALMSAPRYLLLDEPSLGLSPLVCGELFRSLQRVTETGVGILMVEQNAKRSLAIADRGYLLENGRVVGEGTAEALQDNEAVRHAYFGRAADKEERPT